MQGEMSPVSSDGEPTPDTVTRVLFDMWLITGETDNRVYGLDTEPLYVDDGTRILFENPN